MKVNIRYTVDLDEVLEDMSQVYYKSLNKLETKLDFYDNLLDGGFNENDLEQIILALEQYLEFYHDHQTKIPLQPKVQTVLGCEREERERGNCVSSLNLLSFLLLFSLPHSLSS